MSTFLDHDYRLLLLMNDVAIFCFGDLTGKTEGGLGENREQDGICSGQLFSPGSIRPSQF